MVSFVNSKVLTGFLVSVFVQTSPRFVGEMMGFPVDWLELPFQDTAANQFRPMAMP